MAISKTFHNTTSSNNNVYIKQLPTYFFSFKCDIETRPVDLLRDCRINCTEEIGKMFNCFIFPVTFFQVPTKR